MSALNQFQIFPLLRTSTSAPFFNKSITQHNATECDAPSALVYRFYGLPSSKSTRTATHPATRYLGSNLGSNFQEPPSRFRIHAKEVSQKFFERPVREVHSWNYRTTRLCAYTGVTHTGVRTHTCTHAARSNVIPEIPG